MICADCHTEKPSEDFTPGELKKNSSRCRGCVRVRNHNYWKRKKDDPKFKATRSAWYERNKEKVSVQAKDRWEENKDRYEPARKRWAEENRGKRLSYFQDKGQEFRVWVDSLKEGKPCLDCGKTFAPYVMEYDHVHGEKRINISKMAHHRRERVLEEIAKCELVCCACHRTRTRDRRALVKTQRLLEFQSWIDVLRDSPCVDCGETFPPEAMDFDHVWGEKVKEIGQMWCYSRDRVLAEIEKCELVCANCHRERTVQRLRDSETLAEAS